MLSIESSGQIPGFGNRSSQVEIPTIEFLGRTFRYWRNIRSSDQNYLTALSDSGSTEARRNDASIKLTRLSNHFALFKALEKRGLGFIAEPVTTTLNSKAPGEDWCAYYENADTRPYTTNALMAGVSRELSTVYPHRLSPFEHDFLLPQEEIEAALDVVLSQDQFADTRQAIQPI